MLRNRDLSRHDLIILRGPQVLLPAFGYHISLPCSAQSSPPSPCASRDVIRSPPGNHPRTCSWRSSTILSSSSFTTASLMSRPGSIWLRVLPIEIAPMPPQTPAESLSRATSETWPLSSRFFLLNLRKTRFWIFPQIKSQTGCKYFEGNI